MTDLKTMIDARLRVLESVAERLAPTGRMWAVHEIDAAVAGIKSALDQHAAPASMSEEELQQEAFRFATSGAIPDGVRIWARDGYLAAAKRYARPAAPALAPERERLWREATEYLLSGVGAGHWGNCKWWGSDNDGLDSCTCAYGKSVRALAALGRNPDGTWREP